jgi:hypothetical protein
MLSLSLLIGLLAIAFAILRVARALEAIRLQSIAIANEAIQSYDAAHKLGRALSHHHWEHR